MNTKLIAICAVVMSITGSQALSNTYIMEKDIISSRWINIDPDELTGKVEIYAREQSGKVAHYIIPVTKENKGIYTTGGGELLIVAE